MSFATAIPVAIKVASMLKDGYDFVKEHPEEVQAAMDEAAINLKNRQEWRIEHVLVCET